MSKIGRNAPCPCGSGKKYKRCCAGKDSELVQRELPSGHFRYESGTYGGPGKGYVPSILSYKEIGPDSWEEHFCLVKPDAVSDEEDAAASISETHLSAAKAIMAKGGSAHEFALSLRHRGYKSVTDYRIVGSDGEGTFPTAKSRTKAAS